MACRTTLAALCILTCLLLVAAPAFCADTAEERAKLREGLSYRGDADFVWEHLTPNDDYGDWYSAYLTGYFRVHPRITPFAQLGMHTRELEGEAVTGTVGAYVNWFRYLSTYTALGTGTESLFTPMWRVDHDFTFILGSLPLTFTLGAGHIQYWDDHHDWYVAAGPTLYLPYFIADYRLTRNESNPGAVESWSHGVTLGVGSEGLFWIFLGTTFAAQAYTATNVADRQEVRQDTWEINLSHSHWIGRTWGLKWQAAYLNLGDPPKSGYEKWTAGIGVFKEF
ncbi:MAG: YaiO family outer membrane beta-barrel protein [Candidatus Alcyoniella australis]|nr:YaiO family outer membrane beta-barrel protein [Candidatus Alcyoniella australis]